MLVGSEAQALALCTAVPASARRLMRRYWPGPLTLVLPRRPDLDADLGEEDATIGIRCPAHPVPLAICEQIGPIATTSANRHKEPALTTAKEVSEALGARACTRARRRGMRRFAVDRRGLHRRGAEGAAGGHPLQSGDRRGPQVGSRGPQVGNGSGPVHPRSLIPAGTTVPTRHNAAGHYDRR